MVSQRTLARSFENGATSGAASSVRIEEHDGGYALVDTRGKGAVYAFRYPSGHIVAFEGWYGYSPSTSSIMTKMGLSHVARHDDDRAYRANATAAEAVTVKESALRNDRSLRIDSTLSEWLEEHEPTHIGDAIAREGQK